jgi:glutathione S-transferase
MEYAAIIILLAFAQYLYFVGRVGFSRPKFGINPPKTTGHETWERYFRVQQNTLEQLVVFVPSILAFSYFVSPQWVILPGILFIISRGLYSHLYILDPKKRSPAFALTFFTNIGLVLVTLGGVVAKLNGLAV